MSCEKKSVIASILSRDTFHDDANVLKALNVILNHADDLEISAADAALATKYPDILDALYRHDKYLPVTRDVIVRVAASWELEGSADQLKMLLGRANGVEITPGILKSVQRREFFEILLKHQPRCEDTSDILETLANHHVKCAGLVKVLLDQEPPSPTHSQCGCLAPKFLLSLFRGAWRHHDCLAIAL